MIELFKSKTFADWMTGLRDARTATRIQARLDRLAFGNPGDVKPVGEGISELRIDYGPGYRVYFTERAGEIVILLCGGDKKSQDADISAAIRMVSELE